MNDIGQVAVHAASPLFFDPYRENPATGSFVLVDPGSNATVGAGMILGTWRGEETAGRTVGEVVWLGELSGQGGELAQGLRRAGRPALLLDGDALADLDTPALDRVAESLAAQGFAVLIARAGVDAPTLPAHIQTLLTEPTFLGDAI
jgi:bifunctional enzyme CysN/CysC